MSMRITAFGQYTRKLRVEHNEFLKDMAERLGVSVSYLSAVETGKRNIPQDWLERLPGMYDLSRCDTERLLQAASESGIYDKLDIKHLSFDDKRLIEDVVKSLPYLTDGEREYLGEFVKDSALIARGWERERNNSG